MSCNSLDFCLTKENFQVVTASTGRDALSLISDNNIDLLLLDINLPDINGITLYKKIKELKDIPTILIYYEL